MLRIFATLLVLLLLTPPASAQTQGSLDAWKAVVSNHAIPRQVRFAHAAAELLADLRQACPAPDSAALDKIALSYRRAFVAWAGVRHLRFGPQLTDDRQFRIEFWPDRKGITDRHLRDALTRPQLLEPGVLAGASVAIQGFPALERLLFDDQEPLVGQRCALAVAVAGNLATLAADLAEAWKAGTDVPEGVEGLRATLSALQTGLQVIRTQILEDPMGDSPDKARPRRAEAWRSGLSGELLEAEAQALQALAVGDEGEGGIVEGLRNDPRQTEIATIVENSFILLLRAIAPFRDTLDAAYADSAQRAALTDLLQATRDSDEMIVTWLAPSIGVPLGFNALDGD
jgi:uncharacterized protein